MADIKTGRVTEKDVAREAGVCPATVSNYINQKKVKPENAAKIEAAIKKLDYIADASAQRTRTGVSGIIGIIAPHPHVDIMRRVVLWARTYLAEKGYFSVLRYSLGDLDEENAQLKRMRELKVEGILAVPAFAQTADYDVMRRAGIPVVFMSKAVVCPGTHIVYSDYSTAYRELFAQLRGYGHKRIALIIEEIVEGTLEARIARVREAAAEFGLTIEDDLIRINRKDELSMDTGYSASYSLMAMDDPPTAILCANSDMMNGVQIGLLQQGIRFPEDVSVCGSISDEGKRIRMFGDISIINQPTKVLVESAVDMLVNLIRTNENNGIIPGSIIQSYPAVFIDRKSIGPAKER